MKTLDGKGGTSEKLQNALRFEMRKTKILVNEVVGLEDQLANRELVDYGDVITAESMPYWRTQLLTNRVPTLAVLDELILKDDAVKAATSSASEIARTRLERPRPLHNRSRVRPEARLPKIDEVATSKAVAIRNRAHEMAQSQGIPFAVAFRRAEREVVA